MVFLITLNSALLNPLSEATALVNARQMWCVPAARLWGESSRRLPAEMCHTPSDLYPAAVGPPVQSMSLSHQNPQEIGGKIYLPAT